jgi:hypothetical protein
VLGAVDSLAVFALLATFLLLTGHWVVVHPEKSEHSYTVYKVRTGFMLQIYHVSIEDAYRIDPPIAGRLLFPKGTPVQPQISLSSLSVKKAGYTAAQTA